MTTAPTAPTSLEQRLLDVLQAAHSLCHALDAANAAANLAGVVRERRLTSNWPRCTRC